MKLRFMQLSLRHKFRPLFLALLSLSLLLHLLVSLNPFFEPRDRAACPRQGPHNSGGPKSRGGHSPVLVRALQDFSGSSNRSSLESALSNMAATRAATHKMSAGPAKLATSKMAALFRHPLYNRERPELREEDWLFRVRSGAELNMKESGSQEWVSDEDGGFPPSQWNSSVESYPPWLRFHLGINRYELYSRHEPALELLLEQLATHKIKSAVQKPGGTQLKLVMSFPNYGQALFKPMNHFPNSQTYEKVK
ncbi:Extracellular serine/threonine protein kinase FAM20C [Acipenser ruthenus]|uniref:Extracellular serine/threonine protein kinase FAM20C n=1 Tax=Acipenser ruthenus TaxID=7906 RepID=A0A444US69_ACIRT|nr:Extracellular serine/threonine protein kinase FAM20C [Acipenser ruthenus]